MTTLKTYGPPGTGKTTRLLQLLDQELKTVPANRVAFLTFTRSARREALTRSQKNESEFPFCRTIHAICYHQLGVSRTRMVGRHQLREWGTSIGVELTGYDPDPLEEDIYGEGRQPTTGDLLIRLNHLGRHRQVKLRAMLEDAPPELTWEHARWFTEAYRSWKDHERLYDFTDLLTAYLERGRPLEVDVLFVDEAQDLSALQWKVVQKLGSQAIRTYLAGDDDQAIFTWAGASAELFNSWPADRIEVLEQSYRCPASIMEVAGEIAGRIRSRQPKAVKPRPAEGAVDDAGYLTPQDLEGPSVFILYRHHHRGRALAHDLEELTIPYSGHGSPLDTKQVVDAIAAISAWQQHKLATLPEARAFLALASPEALRVREANCPAAASDLLKDPTSIREIPQAFLALGRLPKRAYLRRCAELRGLNELLKPRVTLQSIHRAKGQEADTVILDTDLSRKAWEGLRKNPDDEHRVWYVGVTRSRNRLVRLQGTSSMRYDL